MALKEAFAFLYHIVILLQVYRMVFYIQLLHAYHVVLKSAVTGVPHGRLVAGVPHGLLVSCCRCTA